jgi:PilZ domain-containing protein
MAERPPVAIVGARLVNVSPFGMLIDSPLRMEPEAVHRFRLRIGDDQADVEARVAACAACATPNRYHVGLEFVRVAEAVRARLAEVLGV